MTGAQLITLVVLAVVFVGLLVLLSMLIDPFVHPSKRRKEIRRGIALHQGIIDEGIQVSTRQLGHEAVAEARKVWDDPKWQRGAVAIEVVAKTLFMQALLGSDDYSTDLPMILGPSEHIFDLAEKIVDDLNVLDLVGQIDLPGVLVSVAGALGRALHEEDDGEAFWSVCAELDRVFPQISWHNSMTDGGSKTKPAQQEGN